MQSIVERVADDMVDGLSGLLVGDPGCGKTSIVNQAAKLARRRMLEESIRASTCDRSDIQGIPIPNHDTRTVLNYPLGWFKDMRESTDDCCIFVDDVIQAPQDVQNGLMKVFDVAVESNGRLIVWGATNRPGQGCGGSVFSETLRSRFTVTYELPRNPDLPAVKAQAQRVGAGMSIQASEAIAIGTWDELVASWCRWALGAYPQTAGYAVAWHRATRGRTLNLWRQSPDPASRYPDFRGWEAILKREANGRGSFERIAPIVGTATAAPYCQFRDRIGEIPTPDVVRMSPASAPIPSDEQARFLTVSMLAQSSRAIDCDPYAQYAARLDATFGSLLFADLMQRHPSVMTGNPHWNRFSIDNQDVI